MNGACPTVTSTVSVDFCPTIGGSVWIPRLRISMAADADAGDTRVAAITSSPRRARARRMRIDELRVGDVVIRCTSGRARRDRGGLSHRGLAYCKIWRFRRPGGSAALGDQPVYGLRATAKSLQ